MEVLLGVKIGCLLALLVLTLGCGLAPIYFRWFQMDAATGRAPLRLCPLHPGLSQTFLTPGSGSPVPQDLGCCLLFFIHFLYLTANWRLTFAFRSSLQSSQPPGLHLCRRLSGSRVDAYDC